MLPPPKLKPAPASGGGVTAAVGGAPVPTPKDKPDGAAPKGAGPVAGAGFEGYAPVAGALDGGGAEPPNIGGAAVCDPPPDAGAAAPAKVGTPGAADAPADDGTDPNNGTDCGAGAGCAPNANPPAGAGAGGLLVLPSPLGAPPNVNGITAAVPVSRDFHSDMTDWTLFKLHNQRCR